MAEITKIIKEPKFKNFSNDFRKFKIAEVIDEFLGQYNVVEFGINSEHLKGKAFDREFLKFVRQMLANGACAEMGVLCYLRVVLRAKSESGRICLLSKSSSPALLS